MIQEQNSFTQFVDRLEERISQLKNMYKNEETLLTQSLTIQDFPNHIDMDQDPGVLETSTKIQFHHTSLNLTNIN